MTVNPSAEPDLSSPELVIDPYAGFGRLRERAPVLRGRTEDGSPAWLVTRHRDVRAVLSDHRFVTTLASVPGVGVDDRDRQLELIGFRPRSPATSPARSRTLTDRRTCACASW